MTIFDTPEMELNKKRPCPTCEQDLSRDQLFSRVIFQPSAPNDNSIIDVDQSQDSDIDILEVEELCSQPARAERLLRPRHRAKQFYQNGPEDQSSDDFDAEDSDGSELVANTDFEEEDDELFAHRVSKGYRGKQGPRSIVRPVRSQPQGFSDPIIISSDDERIQSDEGSDIVFIEESSQLHTAQSSSEEFSKFLPSTKMKFMMQLLKQ